MSIRRDGTTNQSNNNLTDFMNLTKISSLLGVVMVLAGAGQLKAQTLTGKSNDPAGWSTVWYDDFTGNALDGTKWNIETNTSGGGNNELQYYGPEGVSVRDGNLVLTASRTANSGKSFTSGRINSRGNVYFTHGKVEAASSCPRPPAVSGPLSGCSARTSVPTPGLSAAKSISSKWDIRTVGTVPTTLRGT